MKRSLQFDTTNKLAMTGEEVATAAEEVSASIEEVASTTVNFRGTLDSINTNAQTLIKQLLKFRIGRQKESVD